MRAGEEYVEDGDNVAELAAVFCRGPRKDVDVLTVARELNDESEGSDVAGEKDARFLFKAW